MKRFVFRSSRLPSVPADCAGFTLAEVLLSSVLGAMLLTALAVNTFGFTLNLSSLEEKAGMHQNPDPDPVLRRMTKDIREAYWAEMPSANHLSLASPTGDMTQYWVDGSELWVQRPNGDHGVILQDFEAMMIEAATMDRLREGPTVNHDGAWVDTVAPAGTPIALQLPVGGKLALAFVAPSIPGDIPGQGTSDEQVLSLGTSIIDLPIAWIPGTGSQRLQANLYESWAPGRGRPYQTSLASAVVNLSSVPQGQYAAGAWQVPSSISHVSLSATLQPGVGYTIVLNATNASQLLFKAVPLFPTTGHDEVSLLTSGSSTWVAQPMVVPFSVKGPWTTTSTLTIPVISRVTMTVYPTNRPLMQRSASLLSQTVSDDPWLGVVPGQAAP